VAPGLTIATGMDADTAGVNWKATHSGVGEMWWHSLPGMEPGLLEEDTAGVNWK
jgi:hypothetical protein